MPIVGNQSPDQQDRPCKYVRLAYNTTEWQEPTGEAKPQEHGTFNAKFGFGYEDWLFRDGWTFGGWRYGFIQGFNSKRARKLGTVDAVLFTMEPHRRRLVGTICDVEILSPTAAKMAVAEFKRRGWFKTMCREVAKVKGAVISQLKKPTWAQDVLNVRFREEDLQKARTKTWIRETPWVANRWRYNAFDFEPKEFRKDAFFFRGRRGAAWVGSTATYRRRGSPPSDIDPIHKKMAEKLLVQLRRRYGPKNVEIEASWVDLTVRTPKGLILFELKTRSSARMVIREALGQILEYAHFRHRAERIAGLVIVGQARLGREEAVYLKRLESQFTVPLSYRQVAL